MPVLPYPAERRALQLAICLAALVPLAAGGAGALFGPGPVTGIAAPAPDLDSHMRYLSGLLLGIGFAFLALVPCIEASGRVFRLLAAIVVIGGLARLFGLALGTAPSGGHRWALVMELGVVPLLALWQVRVARRAAISAAPPG